jgi:hypothetical protein
VSERDDGGSVLMLVPAGILVLLLLAAVAIDGSAIWLAQRDLSSRTAGVAADIAGAAVDDATFYDGGEIRLRPDVADAYTALAFSPERLPRGYDAWGAEVVVDGRSVTVAATAQVRYLFASAIPGLSRTAVVQARTTAEARAATEIEP